MLGYEVGDEFSKLRGRKGNGRRGEKAMERGKGKGSRIMAYLKHRLVVAVDSHWIVQRKIEHVVSLTHNIGQSNELCLCG